MKKQWGGKRKGAGRPRVEKPKWDDEFDAIVNECKAVRAEIESRHNAESIEQYFKKFPRHAFEEERRLNMRQWSPEQRQRATVDNAEDERDNPDREVFLDRIADLDDPSGPRGTTLRGLHTVHQPRIYGMRKQVFAEVAERLRDRHGWPLTARIVERIWKRWRSIERRID